MIPKTYNLQLSKGQAEFMRRAEDPLVIMHTSISYGKSFIAALWLITEMMQGHKCLAGAQTHSALRKVLYTHIKTICRKLGIGYSENKTDRSISVGEGVTLGFSSESEDECLGITSCDGLVLDEASRLSETFYTNMKSRLRGGVLAQARTRLITSPNEAPSARWFNELCAKNPNCIIKGSIYENPFISREFIKDMEDTYGIGTPLYRRQLLGEPIEGDYLNAIVKLEDFVQMSESKFSRHESPYYFGLDCSGMGRDSTVDTIINGNGMVMQRSTLKTDTQSQVNILTEDYTTMSISAGALDMTGGYGNGVYDAVKHNASINLMPVTFGEKPFNDIYLNARSEMYMELANEIRSGFYIDQESNPELIEELRNTQVFIDEKGKFRIIPKERIKQIIGRSPDRADSLALAMYAKNHGKSTTNIKKVVSTIMALNHLR